MGSSVRLFAVAAVAFLAALAAVYASRELLPEPHAEESDLHQLIHEEFTLTPEQDAKIDALEESYAEKRKAMEAELQAINVELAEAIVEEHEYGEKVARTIDRSHHVMGELQKETLRHVFAMRDVLTEEQAARFEQEVAKVLEQSETE